ncbi:hypothetical protein PF004_g26438 [Phytophthora fragariae]|uniref:Uncharacterized protein n=1 Tax=Phytophthora fragariae TaxID=53985 RepID=A0A6G0MP67_9STRA|nr:hypothetical protein PF003_g7549 [Phytophthora fragariae]KAE9175273.1 hypothetical protein PF004_g26438 [Phytophthora fragariae]
MLRLSKKRSRPHAREERAGAQHQHYLDVVATVAKMSRRIAARGGLLADSSGDSSSSAAEPAEASASSAPAPPSSDWTSGAWVSDECFEPGLLDDPLAAEASLRLPSDRTSSSSSSASAAGRGP